MSIKLFITGTDTDCGKTYISVGLLKAYNKLGYQTIGLKPIACGDDETNGDVAQLTAAASIKLTRTEVNPFSFAPPIAPNIAAQQAGVLLDIASLTARTKTALAHPADVHIIEGAGGSHVPLNANETLADWIATQQFATILVVGIKLGCLNHATLALRALQQDNIAVIGWIGNCIDQHMQAQEENIATLKTILNVPCLGIVQYQQAAEDAIVIPPPTHCVLRRDRRKRTIPTL